MTKYGELSKLSVGLLLIEISASEDLGSPYRFNARTLADVWGAERKLGI